MKVYTTSGSIETPIDRSLVPCACGCGDGLAQPSVCCGSMQGLVSKCFSICVTPKPNSNMYYSLNSLKGLYSRPYGVVL